ncbi:hypothetical protein AB6C66_20940 [Vibrio splendidus]|uniref:hypothetical protein n=1 Tax=Vibrio splendidus TaxID=29497 RepID=UPI000372518E|nr:hypothetical protein [Vibrio splendidus]OEF71604.1 hypothetical protein A148_21655 [Vibrio splendidus 1F-157]PMI52372.1 hypothetical protein BCU42_23865 [Vibrio splendidus]
MIFWLDSSEISQFARNPRFCGNSFKAWLSKPLFLSAHQLPSYSLSLIFPQFIIERVSFVGGLFSQCISGFVAQRFVSVSFEIGMVV